MHKYTGKLMTGLIIGLLIFIGLNQNISAQDQNLADMIEVRTTDDSNDAEARQMIERLNNVDSRILYETNRSGVSIILMDVPLTDLPEFQHLSGTVPRGWEQSASTWDDVPGAGGFTTAARIGYSDPGNGHSTINLELHEYAHAVDSYTAGFTFSSTSEFNELMAAEKDALFGDHEVPQYFDVPSEYFAEVFAMYYLGGEERDKLQSRAPQTYDYIDTLHNRIVSFGEITGNTMTIHWDAHDNAESYNIYQNGELVDNVSESEYEATDLETNTNYEFYVEPLNADGDALFTSFFRYAATSAEPDDSEEEEEAPDIDVSKLEEAISQAEEIPEAERSDELNGALDDAQELLSETDEGNVEEQSSVDETAEALLTAIEEASMEEAERPEEDITDSTEEEQSESEDSTEETSTEDENAEDEVSEEQTGGETAEETQSEESSSEGDNTAEEGSSEESETGETSQVETDEESETAASPAFDSNYIIFIAAVILLILAVASAVLIKVLRK
ncbi:anthrax toxin lethal factor-related metalloendopeptidase [Lacicoccus qingdaonensis]|uniref:ATLF-like domain-containing protein n=1 Tax=Lacicoccus qingdaonensis TaxID=576118 RepID=A0A1G9DAL2_9BACL|nr:fibronectin type III domain-containing protein [Salinicoccus qingdaonensis]SDK60958.1 hypothetical protein SAMN05216216_105115 [Salinicoccus qingdaonensis]